MQVAVNQYPFDPKTIDALLTDANTQLIPRLKQIPGFREHYAVDLGNNEGMTIIVCDDEASLRQATQVAQDFVRNTAVPRHGQMYSQQRAALHGQVRFHNTK